MSNATAIHTVLLVPAPGDPHKLLAMGPCGARPPAAYWDDDYRSWAVWSYQDDQRPGQHLGWIHTRDRLLDYDSRPRFALVLAWDGKPVAEGMDRAQRIYAHRIRTRLNTPDAIAAWSERCDNCTVILLDADGREVTP